MHPLIVDLGREYRGGQHQALLLLQGLLERGHTPELIAVRNSLLASRAKATRASVHVVDAARRLGAAAKIRKLVSERRIDIVHANEPHALSSAWLARAHRLVPLVVSRRIALPLSQSRLSLARYRAAARVIAVSNFVKQSVIDSGLAPDRVAVIYDGVQIPSEVSASQREAARKQLGIAPQIPCVGNVAAFVPEKGHAMLLDAFARVRARFPECVMILRGEGRELPKIESRARQLRVVEAVKFCPSSTDVESLFAALDIFVFPSHEEPLGSALLAAMAHGLPCVAIAGGGIPEVMEGGKNGLLVAGKDPEAFAAAVAQVLLHTEEGSRLGQAARETIVARFSVDRMVEETLRLYELLVAGD